MQVRTTVVLMLALASLTGCGQKGPLVRPAGTAPAVSAVSAAVPASTADAASAAQ